MYAIDKFRKECESQAKSALGKDFKIKMEKPPKEIEADLAIPCFAQGKNPSLLASEASEKINKSLKKTSFISKAEALGPYINFIASENYAKVSISEILKKKSKYGSISKKKSTIIIDFSSPNIAKPMNIGHMRSTIIGASLCNIYRFLGFRVIGDNHLGDWGTQFGKLIAAYRKWGNEKLLREGGVEYLTSLYVKFHDEEKSNPDLAEEGRNWFKKLENGDGEARKLWKLFYGLSLDEFNAVYNLLNVRFDTMMGESEYYKEGQNMVELALKKKLAEESEGAIIIDFKKHGIPIETPIVIQKSDESTLYATRDLATIKYRMKKYAPSSMIYVIGSEQKLYMKQLFSAAGLLGFDCDFQHVDFGLYTMDGLKMSTRSGRFVLLKDLLKEAMENANQAIAEKNPNLKCKENVSRQVGIGAVIFNDLRQDRIKNIDFDWKKMLNFDGDSCPYIQYACVRAGSILERAGKKKAAIKSFVSDPETNLAKKLAEFPVVVSSAAEQNHPNIIAQYLIDVATEFNDFYTKCKVLESENEGSRLALVMATKNVIENGLGLLNIEIPDKM